MIIRNETDRWVAIDYLKALGLDKTWQLTIKQFKPRRSDAQRRLQWKWYRHISYERYMAGEPLVDPEVWHEYLARMFVGVEQVLLPNGEIVTRAKSTAKLNSGEMSSYLNKVDHYAGSELGIILPHPDEYEEAMK